MMMNRLIGGFNAVARLATLTVAVAVAVAVAALGGGSSALAATTDEPIAANSLFSISTASGTLTGANDRHLTLHLTGTRGSLTRFADRPLPRAFVVTNGEFARRFKQYAASSRPGAVLTFTRPGGRIPVSIELTVGRPRWNAHHRTWTFAATRIRKPTDNAARHFTRATLLIEGSTDCGQGVVQPYEDCEGADLAFVDLTDADLTGVNFSGANLTGANLSGANLTGANLVDSNLTDSSLTATDLTGSDLSGDDLAGEIFIGSDLHDVDLADADLTGVDFPGVDLTGANLTGANLSDADLSEADLSDADVTGADINGADSLSARFCGAILPQGSIGGGC
jgi:uncharacterized protein YjbI with pentapeptide repeats